MTRTASGSLLVLLALLQLHCAGTAEVARTGPAPAERTGSFEAADPDPMRFAAEIDAFELWDRKNATPAEPVLFVGSSSIRFWMTAERFPGLPVVNRGFGGSHISDVNAYLDRVVLRHAPRVVVFYAGDNDIAGGKSPRQVRDDYAEFVDRVRALHPETVFVYVPIKPSLSRWTLWPQMREANALVRALGDDDPRLRYADVAAPMLVDGRPDPGLFLDDGLHLNEAGYDVWTDVVRPLLQEILAEDDR